jgi:Polyketide cyclase / dehydrase and lipid transport
MKNILMASALLALGTIAAQAQTPQPADWTTLTMTADLNKPADIAWQRIGGNDWCAIAKYLDVKSCVINSGTGEVGSLRTINGTIIENVVARTAHSYTYAQPFTPIFYHGTMAVEPVDSGHSKLIYTLIWNQTAVGDATAQAAARDGRKTRFQAAVDKMAAAANAK